jgi:hypothetical protein
MRIYTSGCPKNQNKYRIGSPPPAGLKNDVINLRSVNSSDNSSNKAVIAIDHTNRGIRSGFMLFGFILIVVMKFTAPRIDDTPAKCNEKIAKSTDAPA